MPLTEHMELAKPFEDAGFTPPQAQALAGLIGAINQRFNSLETEVRTRFAAVDQRFDAVDKHLAAVETSVSELRSEMRQDMRELRSELRSMPWKMFGMMLGLLTAFSAIVLGTVKLFLL